MIFTPLSKKKVARLNNVEKYGKYIKKRECGENILHLISLILPQLSSIYFPTLQSSHSLMFERRKSKKNIFNVKNFHPIHSVVCDQLMSADEDSKEIRGTFKIELEK